MSTKFVGETIYVKCKSLIKNQEVTGDKICVGFKGDRGSTSQFY